MIDPLFSVNGKIALVTGASSGIGAHFAKTLAHYGASVVVAARRTERLEKLVDEISTSGGQALAVALDVSEAESVKAAFDAAEQAFGVIDIVSNNAGVADAQLAVHTDEASFDWVINTNLKGVWLVAMEAANRMIAAGKSGSIVNTASILGLRAALSQSVYGSSKAGVIHLTKNLALELSRKNIRVNALCPGYFITEMTEEFLTSERGRAYTATMPARRTGKIEELTAPFMLLASDAGSFVNGVALPVDGAHSVGNM